MENQRMVMIPEWQYNKMIESYDKIVAELYSLKNEIREFHNGNEVHHDER